MESLTLGILAFALLGFGLVSGRISKTVVTPPMVFVCVGMLFGNGGLNLLHINLSDHIIEVFAELTLILVLFTDASRIHLRSLRREHLLPLRLLLIGLPLTIILGTLVAQMIFPQLGLWEAAVIAAILAPTDAALGLAVISNKNVPIRMRQTINVESGLNDGIMLPVLLFILSCASVAGHTDSVGHWVRFTALQLTLGPLVGIAVGFVGGKAVEIASRRGWMNHTFQDLAVIGLSFLAYAGADLVGGNGFLAAFIAGLTLGNSSRSICTCLYEFGEAEGQLMSLIVFMIFGAVMVPRVLDNLQGSFFIYAFISLTLIRMLPVWASLLGSKLRTISVLFLGWFGPRGLASIIFALLVVGNYDLLHAQMVLNIVIVTVFCSIFAHGMTAYPFAKRYAARAERFKEQPDVAEHQQVSEMPLRISDKG